MSVAVSQPIPNPITLGCFTPLADLQAIGNGNLPVGLRRVPDLLQQGYWGLLEQDDETGAMQVIEDRLMHGDDPVGNLLKWQRLKGFRQEGFSDGEIEYEGLLKSAVKKGIERYFRANKVPKGMIGVSFDKGLELAYNIPANISDKHRDLVKNALQALFLSSVSLLGEVNERGYPVRYIGPYRVVKIPKGVFARGAAEVLNERRRRDCPPGLVELTEDYWMAETATIEGLYRLFGVEGGNKKAPPDHPATSVSWHRAQAHIEAVNEFFGIKEMYGTMLGLPTEAQSERAARGAWVDIKQQMRKEGIEITHENFITFVAGRYENFVIAEKLEDIKKDSDFYTDPRNFEIAEILESQDARLFGMRQYGTASGRLTHEEAWYGKRGTNKANWGPSNGFGLEGMPGEVWEWCNDWYHENAYALADTDPTGPERIEQGEEVRVLRDGSWNLTIPAGLRAAYRHGARPDDGDIYVGFRVAAPQDS